MHLPSCFSNVIRMLKLTIWKYGHGGCDTGVTSYEENFVMQLGFLFCYFDLRYFREIKDTPRNNMH